MQNYLDLLRDILNNGIEKTDRTGTGTLSLPFKQLQWDLSKGFPLVTTKKIHLKSIIYELLWILSGSTNIKYLTDNGVTIWNEWIAPDFEVGGPSDLRPLIKIKKKILDYVAADLPLNLTTKGLNASKNSIEDKLRNAWIKMMSRCYDLNHHRYNLYGAKGIFVAKEWHNVQNFINDIKNLPNWLHKVNSWNEYELDKDYYGSNCYSKETCVWLHTSENNYYTSATNPFMVKIPNENTKLFLTLDHAERELDISKSTLHRLLNNEQDPKTLKGNNAKARDWHFEKMVLEPDYVLRMAFSKGELGPIYGKQWRNWNSLDQIQRLIDEIKKNPDSRRLMVSAWNVADLDQMRLPPCHYGFQVIITGNKLNLQWNQRSVDSFLGLPFNIAFYAILTHMLAQVTGYEPGILSVATGDTHIYKNHIEQVKLQLTRDPFPLPTLKLNPFINNIFDFKYEDIQIENYQHHPAIKAPVAI